MTLRGPFQPRTFCDSVRFQYLSPLSQTDEIAVYRFTLCIMCKQLRNWLASKSDIWTAQALLKKQVGKDLRLNWELNATARQSFLCWAKASPKCPWAKSVPMHWSPHRSCRRERNWLKIAELFLFGLVASWGKDESSSNTFMSPAF